MPDTGSPYNLPYPDLDDIPDIPSDFKGLADRVSAVLGGIDADDPANLQGLPTTGQPLAFYGSGRPDAAGLNLSAPNGSVFTCTDPDGGINFGAAVWRKGVTDWHVTEGDTGWRNFLGYSGAGGATNIYSGVSIEYHNMRRINNLVQIDVRSTVSPRPAYNQPLFVVAGGWQPDANAWSSAAYANHTNNGLAYSGSLGYWHTDGRITWRQPDYTTGGSMWTFQGDSVNTRPWPTELPDPVRSLDKLRELIEEIEAEGETHPQWDTLQQLRDELTALTGTRPGDGGA